MIPDFNIRFGRFAETKRYMDYTNPGSQAKEGSFFGLEAALEGLEPGYKPLIISTLNDLYHCVDFC